MRKLKNSLLLFKHIYLSRWVRIDVPEPIRSEKKIFIIGFNKTGTTSLKHFFRDNNYVIANQTIGEWLILDVLRNRYDRLLEYCKSAEVFQDIPFSMPEVYKILHQNFPDAKFILSVRDSEEQWYQSLYRFHNRVFNYENKVSLLKVIKVPYCFLGFNYLYLKKTFGRCDYLENVYKEKYLKHNKEVEEYFKTYPDSFLKVNLNQKQDFFSLIKWLNIETELTDFPWENKTK